MPKQGGKKPATAKAKATKKEAEEAAPVGRPSKYEPHFCEALVQHLSQGFRYQAFAGVVGVHIDTLYEWEKTHPEFSDAKKMGLGLNLYWWEKKAINHLLNESTPGAGSTSLNSTVYIFNMKNRFPELYRDKQEIDASVHTNNTNTNVDVNTADMTTEQRLDIIKRAAEGK